MGKLVTVAMKKWAEDWPALGPEYKPVEPKEKLAPELPRWMQLPNTTAHLPFGNNGVVGNGRRRDSVAGDRFR
jgi:hypothetical protein